MKGNRKRRGMLAVLLTALCGLLCSCTRAANPLVQAEATPLPGVEQRLHAATAAEDKPALAVTAATAAKWGGRDLAALVAHCSKLTVGAVRGSRPPAAVGACTLPPAREFPDDTALFAALRTGRVTAGWVSTADPRVPAELVLLADQKPTLIPSENVVPLYRRNVLGEQQVLALNGIAGELDTATLTDMIGQVDKGADPAAVAGAWLAQHPLDH